MKNVKFRGRKMNSAVKFRSSIPRQKPKFRGSARNSAGRGKLWALIFTEGRTPFALHSTVSVRQSISLKNADKSNFFSISWKR